MSPPHHPLPPSAPPRLPTDNDPAHAVLLFVFWYCHKRGKEVRLSKEQQDALAAKESASASDSDASPEMEDTIVLDEPGSGADRPGPSDAAAQSEAEAEAALPMGSKEEPVEAAAADKGLQQES